MSVTDEVRTASDRFYAALNSMVNGDTAPMKKIWSSDAEVTTMHPVGGREVGAAEVEGSWEGVAGISSGGEVKLADQRIHVLGDVAYELGTEHVEATFAGEPFRGKVRVTNIYRREGDTWKIVHHHADASPAMQNIVRRMSARQ